MMAEGDVVRVLHMSDTHGLHRTIESNYPLPPADILIHTGDFTNNGQAAEFADFNRWIGELRHRYRYIVLIYGNHEWNFLQECHAQNALDPQWIKEVLPNATHVLEHECVELCGIKIFGSAWSPWHNCAAPADCVDTYSGREACRKLWQARGGGEHRYNEIPEGMDILMTHCPPYGVFDMCEASGRWGSSKALRRHVVRSKPKVHLFGHLHEQRGVWKREGSKFVGGVDYEAVPGTPYRTFDPPTTKDNPCSLICCTAMLNHSGIERAAARIAGPARLIIAKKHRGEWHFDTKLRGQ
eukprot:TRINITY_DN3955_c0_g1_i1.p1 TRINITY_DN3955_c0_g1~~TRINITY_DN3955_c0_g1_i1.p1  ORF type:complete len:311 (+),score=28.24 TRINITY_DN3955_c0_g1_i1:43-933(+)